MKKIATILTVAMLGLMVSCNKEQLETNQNPNPGTGEMITVNTSMTVAPMKIQMADPATKSSSGSDSDVDVTYGALPGSKVVGEGAMEHADEIAIKDGIWVIQFVGTSTAQSHAMWFPLADLTQNSGDPMYEDGSYNIMGLTLEQDDVLDGGRVYFFANVGTNFFTAGSKYSEGYIKGHTSRVATETKDYALDGIPMFGVYEGIVYKGIDMHVVMNRLLAKVVFTYTIEGGEPGEPSFQDFFTPISVNMRNVSQIIYFADELTVADLKLANRPTNTNNLNFEDHAPTSLVGNKVTRTLTWYVPANLKGVNATIWNHKDRYMRKTPTGSNATFVQFIGQAKDGGKTYNIECDFLVGSVGSTVDANGSMGNFNVEQNTTYNIHATIIGPGTGDPRVTIDYGKHMSNSAIITSVIGSPAVATFNLNKIYQGNPTVRNLGNFETAFESGALTFELVWKDCEANINLTYSIVGDNVIIEWGNKNSPGNAIVAAKDAYGVILWSWHLWHNDYDPDAARVIALATTPIAKNSKFVFGNSQVHTYGIEFVAANQNKVMMDRNLGAMMAHYEIPTSNSLAERAWGLIYQWGRKDPMPRGTEGTTVTCYPSLGYAHNLMPVGTAAVKGTALQYSIENPLTFITTNNMPHDWYTTVEALHNDHLWATPNGDKGVYDPCPDGWRVPTNASIWDDFLDAWTWSTIGALSKRGGLYSIDDVVAWYGAPGRKQPNGEFASVGSRGHLWTSTTNGRNAESSLFGDGTGTVTREPRSRTTGLSVRCISE